MINSFSADVALLHDARIFGFLFDNNRESFNSAFYLYVQIFGDFNDDCYHMKKALIFFKDAKIINFSIEDDVSQGQYFIKDLKEYCVFSGEKNYEFIFNSDDIQLKLNASSMALIVSEIEESRSDQYLDTNWKALLY
jgi:hypothetical protein